MLNPPYSTHNALPGTAGIGPIDRESFFTAQRRYRRQTWRLAAYCVFAVFVAGMPASITLTPIVFAIVLFVAGIINLFAPFPPALVQAAYHQGLAIFQMLGWLFQQQGFTTPPPPTGMAVDTAIMILPGAIAMVFLWMLVRAIFARAGVGGILWTLGARPARLNDFKERQLVNIVAEMALAAGIQQPRVAVLDAGDPNAAFIGNSEENAVVVVSRALLDKYSRDEAQGMIAHAIAAIGNGDLKIAFLVVTVKLTQALALKLVEAPFNASARFVMKRLFLLAFKRRGTTRFAAESDEVIRLLLQSSDHSKEDQLKGCLAVLVLPLMISYIGVMMVAALTDLLIIGPPICRMWRTRRLLADASAVQLTRNPDGLTSVLQTLGQDGGVVPGAELASHLFVSWPKGRSRRSGIIWRNMHPALVRRLRKLRKLGTTVTVNTSLLSRRTRRQGPVNPLLYLAAPFLILLMIVLFALLILVGCCALVLAVGLEMAIMSMALAILFALFFIALPQLHHLL